MNTELSKELENAVLHSVFKAIIDFDYLKHKISKCVDGAPTKQDEVCYPLHETEHFNLFIYCNYSTDEYYLAINNNEVELGFFEFKSSPPEINSELITRCNDIVNEIKSTLEKADEFHSKYKELVKDIMNE